MLQIIVSKWGTLYGEEYIDRLKERIEKNCSVPWNLTVIRDHENGWGEYSKKHYRGEGEPKVVQGEGFQNDYHHFDLGGIPLYRKMYPFAMDDHCKQDDTIMMMDIDMLITDDLAYFTTLSTDKPWIQFDYDTPEWELMDDYKNQNITPLNSSVTVWKKGQMNPVYDFVSKYKNEVFFTYRRVDAYLWYCWGVNDFFNYLPIEAVDWYYKGTNAIIRNMAGEKIEFKNEMVV